MVLFGGVGGGHMDITSCFWHLRYKSKNFFSTSKSCLLTLCPFFSIKVAVIAYVYYFLKLKLILFF